MNIETIIKDERAEMVTLQELATHFDLDRHALKDFSYVEDESEPRFVWLQLRPKDNGVWMDVLDVMPGTIFNDADDWDGMIDDTFFSRYVVKYLDGDDEGFVRVGFQYVKSDL